MKTLILHTENNNEKEISIQKAANILKEGGIVAFPTETVYGLGANALNEEAIKKIYIAKGRPSDNPLIVHISDINMIHTITEYIPPKYDALIKAFWPGPLTLIFKKNDKIPDIVTAGLDTVAVRMPDNAIALELINKAGFPVAAPSANISGKPSPTKGEHVIQDLMGKVDAILLGEDCKVGLESTVLDLLSGQPTILRPGGVSKEAIEKAIGEKVLDNSLHNVGDKQIASSPGMKYTHYAPKVPVIVFIGSLDNMIHGIQTMKEIKEKEGLRVGILATEETKAFYSGCIYSVGSREKIETVAGSLFHVLRSFDKEDIDIILSESFTTEGMGLAIMNRIIKSAGYQVMDVGGET
ncbi:MAG: threonylcarbamoyl-AMP synthase [Clostridiales bacterium]|nr:threonylcarbamoyl-AMP synthase [Clostridiales bacterium]